MREQGERHEGKKGKKAETKLGTVDSFVTEYKKCHAKGGDALMTLVYKPEMVPEKLKKRLAPVKAD